MRLQLLVFALSCVSAYGAAVTPACTSFGSLPAATFGGSGIPNDAVCITTITDGAATITLGISATPRFGAPTPTNDGAGTFSALAGLDGSGRSLWNFSYFASVSGVPITNYVFSLLYDLDPAVATDSSAHGVLLPSFMAFGMPLAGPYQGSQNSTFTFLDTGVGGFVNAPPFGPFDGNALGEYTFSLRVASITSPTTVLGQANMLVSTVPEPSTYALFGAGLAVIGLVRRRRRG
jgi:hypothetical protein